MYSLRAFVRKQNCTSGSVLKNSKCQQGYDLPCQDLVATDAKLAALQTFKVHKLKGCRSVDV